MKTALYHLHHEIWQKHLESQEINEAKAQFVLCFASRPLLGQTDPYTLLKAKFPGAEICICSTAGEIFHTEVLDEGFTVTAIEFQHTRVLSKSVATADYANSYDAGKAIMELFDQEDLVNVLIFSDGSHVNGSELVQGMNAVTQNKALVTGGLAGDGDRFQSTLTGINGPTQTGLIVGIGFYGKKLQVSHGSNGGWETFGLERLVTRASKNVLFEIDGKNALELYKRYLGPDADSLPGSALLFPLAVKLPGVTDPVVRTILAINHEEGSMTFAGDIPEGAMVRFMRANFDKLTHAAAEAAGQSFFADETPPDFALLISCVGRKLILQSRIEEEVEAVHEVFGHKTLLSGFYSYGELSPMQNHTNCQLHNQTMTITAFHEME